MEMQTVKILSNRAIGPGYHRVALAATPALAAGQPGQFVMVRPINGTVPLLRRPFSIHRVSGGGRKAVVELLIKVVGPATRAIGRLKKGEGMDVVGPLGRGFTVGPGVDRVAIVAGGIGVAPLVFLAQALVARGWAPGNIRAFVGGRTGHDLLCGQDFEDLGIGVHLTTDDGSAGDQCLVTHPLEQTLDQWLPDMICACGPMAMLRCVAGLAQSRAIACEVSIEATMACGIGACLGCAVKAASGPRAYLHACTDGPVFPASRLDFKNACNFH
jgi:dihydroorotate dehydrogenase electron transfer subunit